MPNRTLFHSSETPAETHNWLHRSTTRPIGRRLLNEPNPSPRRRELTEADLSSRIRLMRQLPYCDTHTIFHYDSKGFKSFTPEYRAILTADGARLGGTYLDYSRSMLERDAEEAGMIGRVEGKVLGMWEVGDRVDGGRERGLGEREKRERGAKVREREEADSREMRARDECEREAREREKEEAHAREMRARKECERKAREREDRYYVRKIEKLAWETRKSEARDHQRSYGSRQGVPTARRRVFEGPPQGQKSSRPSTEQANHNRQKSAPPRHAQSSNAPSNRPQTKTASTQTNPKIPNGRPPPQPQTKQASHPLKTDVLARAHPKSEPHWAKEWSPPSPIEDQMRDQAGVPLEWDGRTAWAAVGNPEHWSEALGNCDGGSF